MDRKKALKLAIKALETERHSIAWDANVVRAYGNGSPMMKKRAQHYEELIAATIEIKKMVEEVGEP